MTGQKEYINDITKVVCRSFRRHVPTWLVLNFVSLHLAISCGIIYNEVRNRVTWGQKLGPHVK